MALLHLGPLVHLHDLTGPHSIRNRYVSTLGSRYNARSAEMLRMSNTRLEFLRGISWKIVCMHLHDDDYVLR